MKNRPVTIKDIARCLEVSYSTVSRALSQDKSHLVKEETRSIVRKTAEDMGYAPNLMARAFLKGYGGVLGLVSYQLDREYFVTQMRHFLKTAREHGYQVLVAAAASRSGQTPADSQAGQIRNLMSHGVEGILINTWGDEAESDRISKTVKGKLPVAAYIFPAGDLSGVVLDHESGVFEITEHLIGLGHERICFLGEDWKGTSGRSAMGKGYYAAMRKYGLTPRLIRVDPTRKRSGYCIGKEVRDRFTALVCCCDYTALGVCKALAERGIDVPGKVAVTGYGDMDVSSYAFPSLTTLRIPYQEIARLTIRHLLAQIQRAVAPRRYILKPFMVVRESCGAL